MTEKQNPNGGIPEGANVTMGETIPVPNLGSSFNPPKKTYITAIYNQWAGKREQAIADLTVYLENPVAIGEHADIGEEIKNKIAEVDKYDSLIDTISKHFLPSPPVPTNEKP